MKFQILKQFTNNSEIKNIGKKSLLQKTENFQPNISPQKSTRKTCSPTNAFSLAQWERTVRKNWQTRFSKRPFQRNWKSRCADSLRRLRPCSARGASFGVVPGLPGISARLCRRRRPKIAHAPTHTFFSLIRQKNTGGRVIACQNLFKTKRPGSEKKILFRQKKHMTIDWKNTKNWIFAHWPRFFLLPRTTQSFSFANDTWKMENEPSAVYTNKYRGVPGGTSLPTNDRWPLYSGNSAFLSSTSPWRDGTRLYIKVNHAERAAGTREIGAILKSAVCRTLTDVHRAEAFFTTKSIASCHRSLEDEREFNFCSNLKGLKLSFYSFWRETPFISVSRGI